MIKSKEKLLLKIQKDDKSKICFQIFHQQTPAQHMKYEGSIYLYIYIHVPPRTAVCTILIYYDTYKGM